MFDLFSWSHILILLTVALIVVGPKDLPRLMHMAGRWAGKARAMANDFKKSFDDMARQTELDELRKEIEALRTNQLSEVNAELAKPLAIDLPPDPAAIAAAEQAAFGPAPRTGELQVTQSAADTPPPGPPRP